MTVLLRQAVVPVYVLLCILLGGSVQAVSGNMVLQLLAIVIIGWSLLTKHPLPLSRSAKALFLLAGATLLLIIVQLIPLPPGLWSAIPGRQFVADGFALLGQAAPWLPISLTPYDGMAAALTLLPALAVLAAMLRLGAYRASWLALAILIGTLAAVLLGALQVSSPDPTISPWYLYRRTNHGVATGFFANSNHMATLLAISIAFLLALVGERRGQADDARSRSAVLLLAVAGLLVLVVGIILNGSLAVLLLGLPVLVISATLLMPQGKRLRFPAAAVGLASVVAILVVYLTPMQERFFNSNVASIETRQEMWSTSLPAIQDHWAVGTGVSSFPSIYPRYEDQAAITRTIVNHAHNDYLEIALETGLPGILLLIAFLLWWSRRAVSVWKSASADRYAQAATIASAAMLVHSLVDYPLRTAALSAILAACLALMARPRIRNSDQPDDLWPTRHLAV